MAAHAAGGPDEFGSALDGAASGARLQRINRRRLVYPAAELRLVRLRECPTESEWLETPEQVAQFWNEHVPKVPWFPLDCEVMCVFLLNTRRRLLGYQLVSTGSMDTLLVHPREVFRMAIVAGASGIVLAHNHPSGDPTPSEADIKVTHELIRAGQLMKIDVLDHVIIGRGSYRAGRYSLWAAGCFCFNDAPTSTGRNAARGRTGLAA